MMRVTVWNEFRHERTNPQVASIYPQGIHEALAAPLRRRPGRADRDRADDGVGVRDDLGVVDAGQVGNARLHAGGDDDRVVLP